MAETIQLQIVLSGDAAVLKSLNSIDAVANNLRKKPIKLAVDNQSTASVNKASESIRYLNTAAARYDAELKEAAASSKRYSAALQSQIQAEQEAKRSQEGLMSSLNSVDRQIMESEAQSRAFSRQLRQQIQAEEDASRATRGFASSETVLDTAIRINEAASREFSRQLRQQMEAEQEAASAADKNAKAHNALSTGINRLLTQFFNLQIVVTKLRQAFSEALTEMKAVDTELTNIQKVSGMSAEEIGKIGEKAYATASKYGVAADEYLSAVYTFQKAGLGDSAELLGELATKTMLVGDTTADIAEQFIVSANAAWNLHGSYEALSRIVDEADYVNNNYATTLEKIAQGLPRVASVAANAGMTAEETIAAIGTITSITQETGSRAGTALRALIMNISGEVGELDDGIVVTEETIKGLGGILEKYASQELEAAQAAGKLIDPMTALQAIAKAAANDLNDADLFSLLSGFGGKLRTNQLTALVNNMDMVQSMLDGMAESAGTADSEISVMLSSWESKTEQLKNTWTEFIANTMSGDLIKGSIDLLKNLIESVGNLGNAIALVGGAIVLIKWRAIADGLWKIAAAATGAGHAFELLGISMSQLGFGVFLVGVATAIALYQKHQKALQEAAAEVESLTAQIKTQEAEIEALQNKEGGLTAEEEKRLGLLQQQTEQLRAQRQEAAGIIYKDWQAHYGTNLVSGVSTVSGQAYSNTFRYQMDLADAKYMIDQLEASSGGDAATMEAGLKALYDQFEPTITALREFKEEGFQLFDEQEELLALFERLVPALEDEEDAAEGAADAFDEVGDAAETAEDKVAEFWKKLNESAEHGDMFKDSAKQFQKAMDAMAEGGFGSKAVEEWVKHTFSDPDLWAQVEGDATALGELANNAYVQALYSEGGEDRGYAFFQQLFADGEKTATETGSTISTVFNDAGEAIAVIEQQADGTLGDISVNIEELAAALGLNVEVLAEVTDAAAYYGGAIEDIPSNRTTDVVFNSDVAVSAVDTYLRALGRIPRNLTTNVTLNSGGLASGTNYARGGPTLVNEEGPELIAQSGEAFIAGGGYPAITNLERGATVIPADETAAMLGGNVSLPIQALAAGAGAGSGSVHVAKLSFANRTVAVASTSSSGSTSSSSSSKAADKSDDPMAALAEEAENELRNLDKQAELAKNRGEYGNVVKIYQKAREVINRLMDAYRQAGYSETSDEILDLQNDLYDYADKVEKVHDDLRKELEETAKASYEMYDAVIDAQTAAIDNQIAAMKEERDTASELNELEEKRLAVLEAQEALQNAQSQRTVRIFNAATGQYEWVANQKSVQSAQDALATAEKNLSEYLDKMSFDAQIEALNNLKTALTDESKARKTELDELFDVFEDPVRDIASVLADLQKSGDTASYEAISRYVSSLGSASNVKGIGGSLSAYAAAIGALYGSDYGTGGTSATSNLTGSDSHDTIYSFPGGIHLTEAQAQVTTIADLARQLRVLGIAT